MKRIFFMLMLLAVAIVISSCNKLPQAEIDAAKTALEQAKTAQADVYLVNEFFALQDSLNVCVVAAESEKSKMFGNYAEVKEKLNLLATEATGLVSKTENRKAEIKNELATAQAEISALLQENTQLLAVAPKGKEGKEALEAIVTEMEGINVSVSEIPGLIESGDLLNAQTKVNVAKEKAASINNELKIAVEKVQKKS